MKIIKLLPYKEYYGKIILNKEVQQGKNSEIFQKTRVRIKENSKTGRGLGKRRKEIMALINCPECGGMISDKAKRCPKCGYPMLKEANDVFHASDETNKRSDVSKEKEISYSIPQGSKQDGPAISKLTKIGFISGGLILAIVIIAVIILLNDAKVIVERIDIGDWKKIEEGARLDTYEGIVTSETTDPFVAVVQNLEIPTFVCMEKGKGRIKSYVNEDNDSLTSIKPVGYINSKVIKDSDIENMEYSSISYYDSETTGCSVTIDIELKRQYSGLMFFEISNNTTPDIEYNYQVVIVDGIGQIVYNIFDLPFKTRGVDIVATPKMFCEVNYLKNDDYSIEKEFSIEKKGGVFGSSRSYRWTEKLKFDDIKDGVLVLSSEVVSGGSKKDIGKIVRKSFHIKESLCSLFVDTMIDDEQNITEPEFDVNIKGYIDWIKLGQNGGV